MRVLVLNAGSSSLKASAIETPERTIAALEVDWGSDASRSGNRDSGLRAALDGLAEGGAGLGEFAAVGHRVVHGGARFTAPAIIDETVLEAIRSVSELAPLHNGVAMEAIAAARRVLPGVPHVAAFDTAFHASLSPEAFRYPVPERWFTEWGIRRYGFHGLSVAWSTARAGRLLGRDPAEIGLVVAHLGSGCSVTAVRGGRSVDTSMGLTPLEGLMMGTRAGSIDPGILLRLLRDDLVDVEGLADALDHGSGLLGISGISGDMRQVQAAADAGDDRAQLAISMFVHRAASAIGSAATSLPRLDAVVFTAGIGEHAAGVRAAIVSRLGPLGVAPLPGGPGVQAGGNVPGTGDALLSDPGAAVAVLRVAAREDLVIAAEAERLVGR